MSLLNTVRNAHIYHYTGWVRGTRALRRQNVLDDDSDDEINNEEGDDDPDGDDDDHDDVDDV